MMKNSKKIAFGGVTAGISLLCMFLSGIFPFAEYTCPALAGIVLIALVIDLGKKTAWICYGAVAFLSLIITPNKEAAMLFIFFLGYYPILKNNIEQVKSRITEWIIKIAIFNTSVIIAYLIIIYVLGIIDVFDNINGSQYVILLLLLGNFVFIIYDIALTGLIGMYYQKIRPKLKKF